jgi:hypothetical protein
VAPSFNIEGGADEEDDGQILDEEALESFGC